MAAHSVSGGVSTQASDSLLSQPSLLAEGASEAVRMAQQLVAQMGGTDTDREDPGTGVEEEMDATDAAEADAGMIVRENRPTPCSLLEMGHPLLHTGCPAWVA